MIPAPDIQPPAISYVCHSYAGIAPEAQILSKRIRSIYDAWDDTVTLGDARRELRVELIELFKNCSQSNWDGYGAKQVTFRSYCLAESALFSLPVETPRPSISAGPSGEIMFEWRNGDDRAIVVSIGPNGDISYAGIFGACTRVRGVEIFDGKIPQTILENINRLLEAA